MEPRNSSMERSYTKTGTGLVNLGLALGLVIVALLCGVSAPSAHADEWNQETILTFSQPVEIPGQVLPAGTYRFILVDSNSNRNIVQVFSSDWSKLYATLFTVSSQRQEPTDETAISFAERPSNQPEAISTWFYPGEITGHEFIYWGKEASELATDAKRVVLASRNNSNNAG
jgi:Protein of unknown function (DUF2911)